MGVYFLTGGNMPENDHTPDDTEQAPVPTIMVVANDLKILKLLEMAL